MSTQRSSIVAGNWKMHGSRERLAGYLAALAGENLADDVRVVLFPPVAYLRDAVEIVAASPLAGRVELGAQDLHTAAEGAFTGETSGAMIADLGGRWVIVGHSERRTHQGEDDALVAAKAVAARDAGLTPVVCVGETEAERDAGQAEAVVTRQLGAVLEGLGAAAMSGVVIAYEPVWAIGTGRTASVAEAQGMHQVIRGTLSAAGADAAAIPLLYGGSVKAGNAAELFAAADIDGGLVGGASLDAAEFARIVRSCG